MSHVAIIKNTFNDAKTGLPVTYERLAITGYVGGEIQTLEIKLEKSELMLAKILLSSNEQAPTTSVHKATEDELDDFIVNVKHK